MILSILIPLARIHREMFETLKDELKCQIEKSKAKVQILHHPGIGSVGQKRQALLNAAEGDYVVFFDADDWPAADYISSIIEALKTSPDVVGFMGKMTTNGKKEELFSISKDHGYEKIDEKYYRFNNHLSPIKKEIALQIGYRNMTYQEDYDYALRLRDSGLIQTEVFYPVPV
jgi:cellulose synthase/poly-beta-1,6-N-acetylglucosamine synthase-like glycosyltransferase